MSPDNRSQLRFAFRLPSIGLICVLFVALTGCPQGSVDQGDAESPHAAATKQVGGQQILEQVTKLESEHYTDELEARHFENQWLVPLWDKLNAARIGERLKILSQVAFESISLPQFVAETQRDFGISLREYAAQGELLDAAEWDQRLNQLAADGLGVVHSDWHHRSFWRDDFGQPYSEFTFTIHALILEGMQRFDVNGTLKVAWASDKGAAPQAKTIQITKASVARRDGPPMFEPKMVINAFGNEADRDRGRADVAGVSVFDLNGDGFAEILLSNGNKIVMNPGDWQFQAVPLIPVEGSPRSGIGSSVGLVADLTGDGQLDWVNTTEAGDVRIFAGRDAVSFATEPITIELEHKLLEPTCITCGDIDDDGDLDLFVAQWRKIFDKMPKKYWDANDGHGNTLLINDGDARFHDATESSGLADKRFRRTYSASFVDLDDDNDLDLLVVSDFAGAETYLNDGTGHFTDHTSQLLDNHYCFGMSHTISDYNNDGAYDIFVLGMGSTTARRLDKMGASPSQYAEANTMRTVMGYGNRMYYAQPDRTFAAPDFMDSIARTGWSWGATSFDFDNDGDQDIYVTNGHVSGSTTQDYCTNFWCRDINVLPQFKSDEIMDYLSTIDKAELQSWDGYQTNRLLVNDRTQGFYNAGFLLDVGFEFDSRRAISADLDLDGRVDLIVNQIQGTTGVFGSSTQNSENGRLIVLQNKLPPSEDRNWIGVILHGCKGGAPFGAKISLQAGPLRQQAVVLAGDSYQSQHPAQRHFGLGSLTQVDKLVITWPTGKVSTLERPEAGKYHHVEAR